MLRVILILVLLAALLSAANVKLYLTDGNYHLVREYEVKSDRVRFYSLERSQWEEMPLDLVDLPRTKKEAEDTEASRKQEDEWLKREDDAERAHTREVAKIPQEKGVYWVEDGKVQAIPPAELEVVSDKKRSLLKVITPIPIVSGKATVVIKGEQSATRFSNPAPEFYFRLERPERFAIISLTPKKGLRQVEEWDVAPVTNEVFEQHKEIEIFRREVGESLYQIWPKQPLEPGEYAVVEFSPGEANIQAWDFSYRPPTPTPGR